ncbi:septum formation family protein [Actinocrispum sp. NPDC049592]|uniref:septum formation family protein n=1 Tax=Actinocrispum sp. NPDC049592 TaxID=3154835 RepID=UPI00343C8CEF
MNDPTSAGLLEIAGPQLYRRNAFRITGLPTDADRRAVRHRQQKVSAALAMGIDLDSGVEADEDEVRRAFDLILGDPRRRLVDEVFWLWDTPDASCGCAKSLHIEHDQAVQAHSAALDKEALGDELSDEDLDELEGLWAEASRRWGGVLRRAAFWDHVRARITALDDKQLTESVIDLLREEVPLTLVKPLIQLAATSTSEPTWLAEQARTWPLRESVIDDQLEGAAEPVYESVKTELAEAVKPLNEGDPHRAAAMVYDNVLPQLKRLNALVPATRHRRTASTRNDVALLLNNCAVRLIDTGDAQSENNARKWLKAAEKLTSDPHTSNLIEENTRALNDMVEAFRTIRERVDELCRLGRTDLAKQMLRNIRRTMAGSPGIAEIDRMLTELGYYPLSAREAAYEGRVKRRMRRRAMRAHRAANRSPAVTAFRRLVGWIVVLGLIGLGTYFLFFDGGSPEPDSLFQDQTTDNVAVGTCLKDKAEWDKDKNDVTVVPCTEEHWAEVIGYTSLGAVPSPYPGKDQVIAEARYNCRYNAAMKSVQSQFTVDFAYPDEHRWNDGKTQKDFQNYATCIVHQSDDSSLPKSRLTQEDKTKDIVWRMDLFNADISANPPVGACIQHQKDYNDNIHDVPFVPCDDFHWAEVIGFPVLYQAGSPWPGDQAVKDAAYAACLKIAKDERGLDDNFHYGATWPGQGAWQDPTKDIYAVCTGSRAGEQEFTGALRN